MVQSPSIIFREASISPVESHTFSYSADTDCSSRGGIETWLTDRSTGPEILWEDQSMKLFRFRQSHCDPESKASVPGASVSRKLCPLNAPSSSKTSICHETYTSQRQKPLACHDSLDHHDMKNHGKPKPSVSLSETPSGYDDSPPAAAAASQSVTSPCSVSPELAETWLQMGERQHGQSSSSAVSEATASSWSSSSTGSSHVRDSPSTRQQDEETHRGPCEDRTARSQEQQRWRSASSSAVAASRQLIRDRDNSDDARLARDSTRNRKPNKTSRAPSRDRDTAMRNPQEPVRDNTNNTRTTATTQQASRPPIREPPGKTLLRHMPGLSRSSNTATKTGQKAPRASVFRRRDPPGLFRGSCASVRSTDNSSHRKNNKKNNTMAAKSLWRTAQDPSTGRTYYFHVETRETQWRKPVELASDQEKEEMRKKEEQQRSFFATMESNILKNLQSGAMVESTQATEDREETADFLPTRSVDTSSSSNQGGSGLERPGLVRTISSMDRQVLSELVKRQPSNRNLFDSSPTDVISERFAAAGSLTRDHSGVLTDQTRTLSLADYSEEFGTKQSEGRKGSEMSLQREGSLGTILSGLPTDTNSSSRMGNSSYLNVGDSFYDKSAGDFGISDDEVEALEQLAEISDQMSFLAFDGEDALPEDTRDRSRFSLGARRSSVTRASARSISLDLIKEDTSEHSDSTPKGGAATEERNRALENMADHSSAPDVPERATMARWNSCGTIYVGSTMSAPDKDATIKCICGVFRAHILQSERENSVPADDEFLVFNDLESQQKSSSSLEKKIDPPTLEDITMFYRDVFRRSQMESDCIIMSLIYVERLIRRTEGRLRPRSTNWRSVLFSCMILASKVWDDLSMWNADFSQTLPAGVVFSLQRINELEISVLSALFYDVKVPASEYAKYYFLLRSMLIKSGLGSENLRSMNPLDVEGAMKLQNMTVRYQTTQMHVRPAPMIRSKSAADAGKGEVKAALEHMIQM